jgi:uncharacterized protein (TIRG00374 family)
MHFMKANKPLAIGSKILFTILLLLLVFQSVDISKLNQNIRTFNLKSLILLIAVYWAAQLICTQRWRIFAAALQLQGSYGSFVQMYFMGMLFNIGLPSLVGGDIAKAYVVSRKNNKPLELGLASVFQDRAAGLISLLACGSLAMAMRPIHWEGFPLWIAYLAAWIAVSIFLWLIAKSEGIYDRLIASWDRTFFRKMIQRIAELHRSLRIRRLGPAAALSIVLLSLINTGLTLWVFRQVTVAAGNPVRLIPFFAVFPLIILATMIPITLGGLGIREWAYVEALSLFGIPRDQGLLISLATSALLVLCNAAGIVSLACIPREMRLRGKAFSDHQAGKNSV